MALTRINNQALVNLTFEKARMPSGSILQVVNAKTNTPAAETGSSFDDISFSASITPTSTSSKILILGSLSMYHDSSNMQAAVTVFRGSVASGTNLGHSVYGFGASYVSTGAHKNDIGVNYLDSPSTTSATTYTVAIKNTGSSGNAYLSVNGETSTITLMEIAG